MAIHYCPCCELPVLQPRATPISESECHIGFAIMRRRGWTTERLLTERGADLDYMAPGMTDWLRRTQTT